MDLLGNCDSLTLKTLPETRLNYNNDNYYKIKIKYMKTIVFII